jgi:hypothetical protein
MTAVVKKVVNKVNILPAISADSGNVCSILRNMQADFKNMQIQMMNDIDLKFQKFNSDLESKLE